MDQILFSSFSGHNLRQALFVYRLIVFCQKILSESLIHGFFILISKVSKKGQISCVQTDHFNHRSLSMGIVYPTWLTSCLLPHSKIPRGSALLSTFFICHFMAVCGRVAQSQGCVFLIIVSLGNLYPCSVTTT